MSNMLLQNSFLPPKCSLLEDISTTRKSAEKPPLNCYNKLVIRQYVFRSTTTTTTTRNKLYTMVSISRKSMQTLATPQPEANASPNASKEMIISPSEQNEMGDIWRNNFVNYDSEDTVALASREQEVNELKEEVRMILLETIAQKSILEQLEFLDDIQCLGVGYHFEDEIDQALNRIYETHIFQYHHNDNTHDLDLYHASLGFRLLRQHGFHVSSDIFKLFLDENGNFEASIHYDFEGMLSLYEASHLRDHGDDILDEALAFTTSQLKLIMGSELARYHPLATKIAHALEQPLHKGLARLESRHHISFYECDPRHSKTLLKFAKLDYNLLQSLHKKELGYLMGWWHDLDVLPRLPYKVRDAMAEIYYCALGTYEECPQYSLGRVVYSKLLAIGTVIDDLYDVCDIADLEHFTEALQRWDKGCVDELPDYMKLVYMKLLDTYEEVEQNLANDGRSHVLHYARESFKAMWPPHLVQSKWGREKHIPTFEDYLSVTAPIIGLIFLTIVGCLCLDLGETTMEEVYEWAQMNYSKPVQAISEMARIWDDIAEDNPMQRDATDTPSVVACYMKQHKLTNKVQAYKELQDMIEDGWKDVNQAILQPGNMPKPVLRCILTQARYVHVMLQKGDGFTESDKTPMKKNFALLFKDPIPL